MQYLILTKNVPEIVNPFLPTEIHHLSIKNVTNYDLNKTPSSHSNDHNDNFPYIFCRLIYKNRR